MHFACRVGPVILGPLPSATHTHMHKHTHQNTGILSPPVLLGILLQSWCRQGLGPWLTRNTPSTVMHTSLNLQNIWIIHSYKYAACLCHYMCIYMPCVCLHLWAHMFMLYRALYAFTIIEAVSEGNNGGMYVCICGGDYHAEAVRTRKTLDNIKYSSLNNQ